MNDFNFHGLTFTEAKEMAEELIAAGSTKLASMPSGGGAAPAAEAKKEEKKVEEVHVRLKINDTKPQAS